MTFTTEKQFPSGAWHCCTVVGQQLVKHTYYGYPKREAQQLFRAKLRELTCPRKPTSPPSPPA